MEINYNEEFVSFDAIEIGDVFISSGKCYMKVKNSIEKLNVVALENGSMCYFNSFIMCYPRKNSILMVK